MSDSNPKRPGQFGEDGAAVIQVTPGQIVGAALFLLVAAAVIFFAGMFARGLTMNNADDELASAQQESSELDNVTVLPAPDPEVLEPEPVQPVPEPTEEPAPVEPAPAPEPEVTEEALTVIEPEPVTVEDVEPEPPMETEPPEPETTPEPPTPPEPEPEPKPKPLPQIPPSTSGPFTVQVMSIGIAKRAQAEAFQRNAHENQNVQIELVESADGKLLRAFVGSYANRSEAETARDELTRAGFEGCFIKKRDE